MDMRTIGIATALLGVVGSANGARERWVWVPHDVPPTDEYTLDILSPGGTMVAFGDGFGVWSEEDGLVEVPNPPDWDGGYPSNVAGMSADGGRVIFELSRSAGEYLVWTRGVGFQPAEDVFTGIFAEERVMIRGISRDGYSIVGARVEGGAGLGTAGPAVRWFDDGTVQVLGVVLGFDGSVAYQESEDGSVIAGTAFGADFSMQPFVWTGGTGFSEVPVPPGYRAGIFLALSADGSTCGGTANTHYDERGKPMLWRSDTGYRILDYPGPEHGAFDSGYISALTADGTIAFGIAQGVEVSDDRVRFIWTEETGVIPAAEYVNARIEHPTFSEVGYDGVWGVKEVLDISDDGRTFLVDAGWDVEWEEENGERDYGGSLYLLTITLDDGCPGDITGDGRTNAADFVVLARRFGQEVEPRTNGDLTGNGTVTVSDFLVLMGDFGCGVE